MTRDEFLTALDAIVAEKHLLKHPFYQLWSQGKLTRENLREYAISYYPHVAAFPTYVSGVHSGCEDAALRQELLENLIEEERGPENHPELWLRFCEALGLDRGEVENAQPNDATRALIGCMHSLARDGGLHEGLAALYSYESQVPDVAKAKIDGLAKWYGVEAPAFFTVHMDADVAHSQTSRDLLNRLCDSPSKTAEARAASSRTLSALYGFLDTCATMA